jgi:hypothetical protein
MIWTRSWQKKLKKLTWSWADIRTHFCGRVRTLNGCFFPNIVRHFFSLLSYLFFISSFSFLSFPPVSSSLPYFTFSISFLLLPFFLFSSRGFNLFDEMVIKPSLTKCNASRPVTGLYNLHKSADENIHEKFYWFGVSLSHKGKKSYEYLMTKIMKSYS